jgi:hypothetical protein
MRYESLIVLIDVFASCHHKGTNLLPIRADTIKRENSLPNIVNSHSDRLHNTIRVKAYIYCLQSLLKHKFLFQNHQPRQDFRKLALDKPTSTCQTFEKQTLDKLYAFSFQHDEQPGSSSR